MSDYSKQHRGERSAYDHYYRGMDASMQQKVALTTAYFPTHGRIVDMGSGSGSGTYDLARLHPGLELIGVDINPVSVQLASEKYAHPNLSYRVGDISQPVFPANSLDGILDSSVLHHITSFNQFKIERVYETFDHQIAQLKTNGVIIVRDFVIPDGPEMVWLDLPTNDGAPEGEVSELATSALFERFARDWRSSVNPDQAVPYVRLAPPQTGRARYELRLRAATEFILRKDYRADWDAELLEEYTYLSQSEFEAAFRARGLRIVCSMPIWNPWIVANRFVGRFGLSDVDGFRLPFPPTNYLIVGEKVATSEGVELVEERRSALSSSGFLARKTYRHNATDAAYELIERPHQTIDLLPWFEREGQIFVLAKKDFPRPIINACNDHPNLNHATRSGYITEPISALIHDDEKPEAAVPRILQERANVAPDAIISISEPFIYFTSPGGLDERVLSFMVQITAPAESVSAANYTQFSTAGIVRELNVEQALRASQVGGMFDARLELNMYRLMRALRRWLGPWIGTEPKFTRHPSNTLIPATSNAISPTMSDVFTLIDDSSTATFLNVQKGIFAERTAAGETLAAVNFEYVVPRDLSRNTVVAVPVVNREGELYVGFEHRDLPAAQHFTGNARLAIIPAWRVPMEITDGSEISEFVAQKMQQDFGLRVHQTWELSGTFFPTPGATPEIVYPYLVELEPAQLADASLHWVELGVAISDLDKIQDAHSYIAICRLGHLESGYLWDIFQDN